MLYNHIVLEIDNSNLKHHKHSMNPDSIYRHIGEVIKTRRKALTPSLTQESLAQRLGISRASLANIEIGRQSVMVHQLYAFAKILNLPPSDFLPPVDSSTYGDWGGLMPDNLKPGQKDQIARMLGETPAEPTRDKEGTHVNKTKR